MKEKKFPVRRFIKELSPEDLGKYGSVRPLNLRDVGGVLVAAANFENLGPLDAGVRRIIVSSDTVYCVFEGGRVRDFLSERDYSLGGEAFGVVTYCDGEGVRRDLIYGENGVTAVDVKTGTSAHYPECGPARRGAIFRERLFLADGNLLTYSAPLKTGDFDLKKEDTGKIRLSDVGGDVLALVPYGRRLALFRTREILLLTADANDLYFAFERLKFDGGEVLEGSVGGCGDTVLFRTEKGLFRLDGEKCTRVEIADSGVVFPIPAIAAAGGGEYYSAVKVGGVGYIFVYDPAKGKYYLTPINTKMIGGGAKGVYIEADKTLLHVGGEGYSIFDYSVLTLDLAFPERAAKYVLEGISVAGKGNFTLSVIRGLLSDDYKIAAYEVTHLRHTLPLGSMRLVFHTFDTDVCIRGIVLHLREVGA